MPIASTIRTALIGTDPNAAQPAEAAPVEIFGEIISGLAEASVEGTLQGSAPVAATVTAEIIATNTSPAPGESEVAKTVEQLLALTYSHAAGATTAEALEEGETIRVAPEDTSAANEVVVPQEMAAAVATIEQLPQYRPITLPTDTGTPVPSIERPEPEAVPISDLPQIAQVVPAQVQPDLVARQAPSSVPRPTPAVARIDVVSRQARADVLHPAPAGTPINLEAKQAVIDVQQPAPAGAQGEFGVPQAGVDVPRPEQAGAQADFVARQAFADVPHPAAAGVRIVGPQAGRIDQEALLPIPKQPLMEAPQIASSRTETVVQLALSGLEAAVKAMPAQISAAHSANPSKRSGDTEPAVSLPELKLSTAMALPPIHPIAAAFETIRPLETASIGALPIPQPLDAGELVIEHQLDMAHEGEWLDQLARDITRSAGSDSSPLRFRLNPENLGSLRVEISQDRNGAAVRLTTDTEAARTIIADAQPRLIAEARAQGIRISEAHVDLGGQTASGDPRRQNAVFEEAPLRTARSLQEDGEGDGNPTPGRSERYA
jgi:hypothetical protein